MLNPSVQFDWVYCMPAVDPEQEKEQQERAEPKAFHVRIAHLDPHTHQVTVNNNLVSCHVAVM